MFTRRSAVGLVAGVSCAVRGGDGRFTLPPAVGGRRASIRHILPRNRNILAGFEVGKRPRLVERGSVGDACHPPFVVDKSHQATQLFAVLLSVGVIVQHALNDCLILRWRPHLTNLKVWRFELLPAERIPCRFLHDLLLGLRRKPRTGAFLITLQNGVEPIRSGLGNRVRRRIGLPAGWLASAEAVAVASDEVLPLQPANKATLRTVTKPIRLIPAIAKLRGRERRFPLTFGRLSTFVAVASCSGAENEGWGVCQIASPRVNRDADC